MFQEKRGRRHPSPVWSLRVTVLLAIVFACCWSFAQTVHPLAQQWTDKRVERERTIFLRQSWQISQTEFNNRIKSIDTEQIPQLLRQIQQQPRDEQVQIRQQSDSLFNVRVAPLRQQWQQERAEREKKIRADIAADAEQAGRMQASRTLLNERLQRREIPQSDFTRDDQNLQQSVFALQTKWDNVDPAWGQFFTGSWQARQTAALADLRKAAPADLRKTAPADLSKKEVTAKAVTAKAVTVDDQDVQALAAAAVEMQHNGFLRNRQVITDQEEQQRNGEPQSRMDAIQAKYSGAVAKDLQSRAAQLVDARVNQLSGQWEAEARSLSGSKKTGSQSGNEPDGPAATTRGGRGASQPTGGASRRGPKAYLNEMPETASVLREIRGNDATQAAACQAAALTTLRDILYAMNGIPVVDNPNPSRLTPEEQRREAEYTVARTQLLSANPAANYSRITVGFHNYVVKQFFVPGSPVYSASYIGNFSVLPCDASSVPLANRPWWTPLLSRLSSLSSLLLPIAILLGVGALGLVLYRRHLKKPPAPHYADLKTRYSLQTVAEPALERRTASERPSKPAVATDFKQQLFAEQREKYQAHYNDVADAVTAALAQLGEMAPVLEGIRENLKLLANSVVARLRVLLHRGDRAIVKPVIKAALKGLVLTIIIAVILLIALPQNSSIFQSDLTLVLIYVPVVALLFFREWRRQSRFPLEQLKHSTDDLKKLSLAYVYEGQVPQLVNGNAVYQAIRISTANANPEYITVPAQANSRIETGTTLLILGEFMAVYRVAPNGAIALEFSDTGSSFMSSYGSVITQAISEQKTFAMKTCAAIADYARVDVRKRRATEELPQIEKLIKEVERIEMIWRDTYTSNNVFEFLLRRIDLYNMRDSATPRGILLHGYAGNGKTHLARKIAESVSARFEEVGGAKLTSAQEVTALWEKSRDKNVVLFVKNADRVFPKPGSQNAGGGTREATMQWITEWEKQEPAQSRVWVVLTAQDEKELDTSILAQFSGSKIQISPPDIAGRALVLRSACRANRVPDPPEWLAGKTGGASVHQLYEIVKAAKLLCAPNAPEDSHWHQAINDVRRPNQEFINKDKTWDKLVLPKAIKEQLQRACRILQEADVYKEKKIDVPSILLFGPPGTGKTDIARTIANESGGVNFFSAGTADLKGEYVGHSSPKVRKVFIEAREAAPSVLFIDEIENVSAKREGGKGDSFTQDIVNELLTQMDGVSKSDRPVLVLAATNLPEQVDKAILSRFTSKIEVPLPDEPGRREILKGLISERDRDPSMDVDEISAVLAKELRGKSGRDLVMFVNRAMQQAAWDAGSAQNVRLTRQLLLDQAHPQGDGPDDETLRKIWEPVILKQEIKDTIISRIKMFNRGDKAAPRGLLLYGPSGTGKTEIAKHISESTRSHFMDLKGPDLKAGVIGGTGGKVKGVWETAGAHDRCIMFIDECEGVFARRGGLSTDSFAEEGLQAFLAMWDGVSSDGHVWVIGATNRPDIMDEAAMQRFGNPIEISLPNAAQRMEILRLEMGKLERPTSIPDFVARATTGFSGRRLAELAREISTMASERNVPITPELWSQVAKSPEAKGWIELVLSPDTLNRLQRLSQSLSEIESLQEEGVEPRGALLFGPAGTGKTKIARTLAETSGLAFISAGPADLKGVQPARQVRELFERARSQAPSILFIDEIEAVAAARSGRKSDSSTDEIVTELLGQMDGAKKTGRHVFVVAATNYVERVDNAIKDRFTYKFEIPLPDQEQREQLFKMFLSKRKRVDFDIEVMSKELAANCGSIGGRQIEDLVRRALERAIQRAFDQGTTKQSVLTRDDLLSELSPSVKVPGREQIDDIWKRIVVKPDIAKSIRSKIDMFNAGDKAAPRGLLLYGPPGTGKTEIARRIAESTGSYFMDLKGADLKAGFVGQTGQQVNDIWETAHAHPRTVMFVDECEGAFGRRGSLDTDKFAEEGLQTFLANWNDTGSASRVWVIGATNRREMLDDAAISRFGAAVKIDLPDEADRVRILNLEMQKLGRNAEIPDFAGRETTGFSGRKLSTIAADVCTLAQERSSEISPEMWHVIIDRHREGETVPSDARWDSLIVPESTLKELKAMCASIRGVEAMLKRGFEPMRGALLYGPPGTGKTQIARTLANESRLNFIAAGPADLKAGYVGQNVHKVKELFERARAQTPCILFIDEIDAVAADRDSRNADSFTVEIVNEMLRQIDGVKKMDGYVFVLAATNRPDLVDEALQSRFEKKIEIGKPDPEQRRKLFKLFLSKVQVDFDVDAVATDLALQCGDVSGRDIQSFVRRAAQHAIQRTLEDSGDLDNLVLTREDIQSQIGARRLADGAAHA